MSVTTRDRRGSPRYGNRRSKKARGAAGEWDQRATLDSILSFISCRIGLNVRCLSFSFQSERISQGRSVINIVDVSIKLIFGSKKYRCWTLRFADG